MKKIEGGLTSDFSGPAIASNIFRNNQWINFTVTANETETGKFCGEIVTAPSPVPIPTSPITTTPSPVPNPDITESISSPDYYY